jgi:hypothetical protein
MGKGISNIEQGMSNAEGERWESGNQGVGIRIAGDQRAVGIYD